MTIKDLHDLLLQIKEDWEEDFNNFKTNEFYHFRDKIEKRTFWILTFLIATLAGIIIDLILTKLI